MIRFWLLWRTQILTSFLVLSLFFWALFVSLKMQSSHPEIYFIKFSSDSVSFSSAEDIRIKDQKEVVKNSQGLRIQEELSLEDEMIFEKNFLRTFVMYTYNFDKNCYEQNLNRASYLYSDEFWVKLKEEIPAMKKRVFDSDLAQTSVIEKVTKISSDQYDLITSSSYRVEHQPELRKYKIHVKVQKVPRTRQNPWGLEVTNADQERI